MQLSIERTKNRICTAIGTKALSISTFKWIIISILMITPVLLTFFFIKEYGVNVPVFDQWVETPLLFDRFYRGLLSFNDLFAPYWEHRPFLGRLVVLSLGFITHYNNVAEMYLSWFLLCITCVLVLRLYIKYFGASQGALIKFIPVVWLLFSLRQWESLLRGDTFTWFMTLLFFVLTVYLLHASRNTGWRFAFAAISGIACAFSNAVGLTVWPIGLILILLNWRYCNKACGRICLKMVIAWCIIAILVYVAYFTGFSMLPGTESHYYKDQPLTALNFILIAIGSPLALDIWVAAAVGISLLTLYVYSIIYIIKGKFVIPPVTHVSLAFILFALFTVILLVPSRSGMGLERAMLSRYTTFIGLGITGLYLLILQWDRRINNLKPILFGFVLALMIPGLVAVDSHAIAIDGKMIRDAGNKDAYYITNFETQSDDDLAGLCYGHLEFVKDGASILKKYQLNVFSPPYWDLNKVATDGLAILKKYQPKLTPLEGSTSYSIDLINGRRSAPQGSYFTVNATDEPTVTIHGWAIDQAADDAAGGVFASIDGKRDFVAQYGKRRPDVAASYNNDNYKYSGFSASFATSQLGRGTHSLTLKIVNADRTGYYQIGRSTIDVR